MSCFILLLCNMYAFAQDIAVTGYVRDAHNEPLIGVSVVTKGTNTGWSNRLRR